MIKVEHTRTHNILQGKNNVKGVLDRLVTDGELVLVDAFNYAMREYYGTDKVPILISRTEKIKESDRYYDKFHGTIHQYTGVQLLAEKYHFKILALPEHFSPEQLQMIVDGKLKEGKCLVECKEIYDEETIAKASGFSLKVPVNIQHQVKLNPHITIYPTVEEKMYTREDVKKIVLAYKAQPYLNAEKFEEWFEQNVK